MHLYCRTILISVICLLAACGGGGGGEGGSGAGNSLSTPVNLAPLFSGTSSFEVLEAQELSLSLSFSDPEGRSLTQSITGGEDQDQFAISVSGTLDFVTLPDYENPGDQGADNNYQLVVTASDGTNQTSQNISISLINVMEARVVDGPVSGSQVFIDENGDSIANINEATTTTDAQGFFTMQAPEVSCLALEVCDVVFLAVGGVDIATNNDLGDLVLSGAGLLDEDFNITPISTMLVNAADPQLLLDGFGLGLTVADIATMDPWQLTQNEDPAAEQLLRTNQQLLGLMLTANSLVNIGGQIGSADVNATLAELLSDYAQNNSDAINLARAEILGSLLNDTAATLEVPLADQSAEIIASRLAILNNILMDSEIAPTEEVAAAVISSSQVELQTAVEQLGSGAIDNAGFDSLTSLGQLFAELPVFELLPDLDEDGLADVVDEDDDGDGVLDSEDAFPRDSSETVDTDGDEIGDNQDPDDDNDGVGDNRDPFPLDSSLTPPTVIISADVLSGSVPLMVNFDGTQSNVGSGDADNVLYSWSFGDGAQANGQQVEHVYAADGEFSAELTITNEDDLTHSAAVVMSVSPSETSYSVSGTIVVAESMAVDSDVNNSDSLPTGNNSLDAAQLIPNPVTLAGYANTAGEGEEGASRASGDVDDVYAVNALGGEIINLNMSDPNQTDLDLYIYNSAGDLVDYSIGVTQFESSKLPDNAGIYYINVTVYDTGASTYVLTIGRDTEQASTGWSAADDFVIGDVIVQQRQSKLRSTNNFMAQQKSIATVRSAGNFGPALYSYGQSVADEIVSVRARSMAAQLSEIELKAATLRRVKAIAKQDGVEYAEPNYIHKHLATTPEDPRYQAQWHYPKINLPAAWDISTGDNNVKVAVLDTGVFDQHPDLVNRMSADDYDFIEDASNSGDGDGMDADGSDPGDGRDNALCSNSDYATSSFHGTHVAGTIGADSNNGMDVSGVTWAGEIMNLRVLGCLGGYDYDIANAIRYAAGLENSSGVIVADPADIINMSLGGGGSSNTMQQAVTDARNAGVVIIAAAGNSSSSQPSYPAAYEGVVSVSATNTQDGLASYSNYGTSIDISAPGGEYGDADGDGYQDLVLSTLAVIEDGVIQPTVAAYQGTSMAAPHVAGVVSLIKAIYPQLTPDDLDALIVSGDISVDLGSAGRDNDFGHGRIDALKAVNYANLLANGTPIPVTPILQTSYSYLNFGRLISSINVSTYNSGNGDLVISDVQVSESFVTVTSPGSDDGLGSYQVSIDRAGMDIGIYGATITFSSNGGDIALDVRFEVAAEDDLTSGNAGLIYTILYNVAVDETVSSTISSATDGEYQFSLDSLGGVYNLIAGSDSDNDGYICGPGEACGLYPLADSPVDLILNEDLTEVDFGVTFVIPSSSDVGINRAFSVR